ncbi:sugar ABC transporter substrate-binding protein [Aeromicrobium senzhongii]|uniref:Sugar ABC transporter substrate-binding protein n=1 Tax=Aeromicrobium senzhongii TaxID=2663859 RepID=A0ABX6SUK5_9ACTN|nr:sugar ABC transporter substrate-binding protein [Aeromicrobium senzhongii]MTB89601.1 substrate-binding domain-containing protein [Aeromicrobium senzhongii]QNL94272.1 sugar ABC transporter substrate-binding protein [Aeromicrobium senzhongii]
MKFRRIALGATMALAMVTAAACGGSSSNSGGDDSFSVGIVRFAPSEVTTEAVINKYTKLAEDEGWEVTTANPDGAVDKAIGAMQDFVQKDVDLIIVSVIESTSLAAGLKSAEAAGIPVASIAGGTADGIVFDLVVSPGTEVPEAMVANMGGKGRVLALGYKPGLPCQLREDGFNEAVKGTDITVDRQEVLIPGQLESGQKFATTWLAKNPKGSEPLSIWACFDDPAMGSIVAAKQAGRDDVKIYGYDGTPPALKALKDGQLAATAAPDTAGAAQMLFDATPGLIEAGVGADAKTEEIPYPIITPETLDQYLADNPGANAS